MIDYHLHLWSHGPGTPEPTVEALVGYVATAAERGVERIAITEHSHRFVQVDRATTGIWDGDDPVLAASTATTRREEQGADLDRYCEVVQSDQHEGLPVELGIEVDLRHIGYEQVATYPGGHRKPADLPR